MNRSRPRLAYRPWSYIAALLLFLSAGGDTMAQTVAPGGYYEICRRLGFIPNTTPHRRCITKQRDIDLDPLNYLSEYDLIPPAAEQHQTPEEGLAGKLPGATSAEELLKSSPETLLLGPDYRAQGQGIFE
jgi:hypothetical protein